MLKFSKLLRKAPQASLFMRPAMPAKRMTTMHAKSMSTFANKYKYKSYSDAKNQGNSKMYPLAAFGMLSLVAGYELLKKRLSTNTECCGIIGYIGQDNIAGKLVLDGLQILQYRGYDS